MARAGKNRQDGEAITIKKYANRRLYNTDTSAYITLDDLARMTREGREFVVLDAKSNEDITHTILAQIIMESEGRGEPMLPANFLRQIIALYGDSMQSVVPHYLDASMQALRTNGSQWKEAMEAAIASGPFGELHKRNMAMFEAATSAFRPAAPEPDKDAEIAALKAEMEALKARLERLG